MPQIAISVNAAPAASGNYSQAIGAGGLLFVAGNGPYDPDTREVVGGTIEEQTDRTMRNIEAIRKYSEVL
jgi:2-iminobutanoate/2-iminopropanoate deaminase